MTRAWYAAPLILSLLGCPVKPPVVFPTPPAPTPTPTPTPAPVPPDTGKPTSPVGLEYLLRTQNAQFVRAPMGGPAVPHSVIGAIPCWPPDGTGDKLYLRGELIRYWWPLVSPDWIAKSGGNMFHMRPGPIAASEVCCGLEDVGPPYAPDGSWNQPFWDRFHVALRAAVAGKSNVEVDVVDGWILKHARYGDVASPFTPAELQHVFDVPLIPRLKAWIAKVVGETTLYGNVVYQISNESALADGWTSDWERAVWAEIRADEQQIVHLVGSNSKDWSGPYDYFSSHDPREGDTPLAGRPVSVNEENPHLTPATFHSKFCSAKAAGQAFWYWRSDGSNADQDASLASLDCTAPPANVCSDPLPDRSRLVWNVSVNKAAHVADPTPTVSDYPYCISIGMGTYNGGPRGNCPARNECAQPPSPPNPPGLEGYCEQRLVCEQYLIEAAAPVWSADGDIIYLDDYKFRIKCPNCTWAKVCNGGAGDRCTEVSFK